MLFVIQTLSLLSIILPVFASENRVLDAYSEANDLVLTGVWRKLHAVSVVNGETVWSSSIAVGGILLPDPSNTSFICFMHLNYTEVPPKNIPLQDNIISKTDMGFFVCADAVVNAKVATLTPRWIFPKQSNFASFSILRPNGSRALIGYADDLTFKVLSSESGELVASIDLLASFKANVDPSLTTLFCSQEYYAGKDQIVIFLCNAGVAAINITNLNDTMRDVPLGSLWWSGSHNAPIYNTLSISSDGYVVFGIRDPSNSFTALNISNGNKLWETKIPCKPRTINGRPTFIGNRVIAVVDIGYENFQADKSDPGKLCPWSAISFSKETGEIQWTRAIGTYPEVDIINAQDKILVISSFFDETKNGVKVTAIDASAGTIINSKYISKTRGNVDIQSNPVIITKGGNKVLLHVQKYNYAEMGSIRTTEKVLVLFSTQGSLSDPVWSSTIQSEQTCSMYYDFRWESPENAEFLTKDGQPVGMEQCGFYNNKECSGYGTCVTCTVSGFIFRQCACDGNNGGPDCSVCSGETYQDERGDRCKSGLEEALKFLSAIFIFIIVVIILCCICCVARFFKSNKTGST